MTAVRWILRGAGAVLAIGALALVVVLLALPMVTRSTARTVLSGSMTPALAVGSVVLDKHVSLDALHVGDIATYRQSIEGHVRFVTHRIVAIDRTRRTLTFRGDANPSADPEPVPVSAVEGRVWLDVPVVGSVRSRLTAWRAPLVSFGVLGLGAYALVQVVDGTRQKGRTA